MAGILYPKYLDNLHIFWLKIKYNLHVTGAQLFDEYNSDFVGGMFNLAQLS
jgi:hypothetical protein